jgi:hypothetical protein
VTRARDTRLARLTARGARADSAEAVDRCALRAWVAVRAVVNDGLAHAGIDPARARALRLAPHPGPLAPPSLTLPRSRGREGWGQSEPREPFEEIAASDSDGLASVFAAKIDDMTRRYQDGSAPDFANASVAELFAWCLAQPNATHSPAPPHAGIVA